RPHHLHGLLHRRDRARRHSCREPRTDGGSGCARPERLPDAAPRRHSPGDARHHPAPDKPIPQPDKELIARRGHRLSRACACVHGYGVEPNRPGDRDGRRRNARLSHDQSCDLVRDEFLQPEDGSKGALSMSAGERRYDLGRPPALSAPVSTISAIRWLRQNLFATWSDAALTLLIVLLLAWLIPPLFTWAIFDAHWRGGDRSACVGDGACWVFVRVWFERFIYGLTYPLSQSWRIDLAYAILLVCGVLLFIKRFPWKLWVAVFLIFFYPIIAYFLFVGGT